MPDHPALFQQFLVLGVDKTDLLTPRPPSDLFCLLPKTLHQFPSHSPPSPASQFAFPNGLTVKRIKIRNSFSQLNEIIFHNQKKIES